MEFKQTSVLHSRSVCKEEFVQEQSSALNRANLRSKLGEPVVDKDNPVPLCAYQLRDIFSWWLLERATMNHNYGESLVSQGELGRNQLTFCWSTGSICWVNPVQNPDLNMMDG